MAQEATLLAAFTVALLGGVHCAAMCGGIAGALALGSERSRSERPRSERPHGGPRLSLLLAYNLGRITSYVVAGALAGGAGAWAANLAAVHHGQLVLQAVAGVFLVLLGLYLGGWWQALAHVERAGGHLWRRIAPLGRHLVPVRTLPRAAAAGLVWGWLPCGLVYSVLVWSLSAGSAAGGALLMAAFGLGTLPALLAMGTVAAAAGGLARRPGVRQAAGVLVVLFGLYQLRLLAAGAL